MSNSKTRTLALITARGGSKGLPKKNILPFHQKPMIAWSIEAAKKAACVDDIVVSTECQDIAETSKTHGASVPFMRPYSLASDDAGSMDVIMHALETLKNDYDYIFLLQPTSPLRTAQDIDDAFQQMRKLDKPFCVSVTPSDKSPYWHFEIGADQVIKPFLKVEDMPARRQDASPLYVLNGAIYIASTAALQKTRSFVTESNTATYVMPLERAVDIDTKLDFDIAEYLMSRAQESGSV